MEHFDEKILELRRSEERRKYNSLETGIYVEDELITFVQVTIPGSWVSIYLPENFIVMPDLVKDIKYASQNAPDFIITSLDSTVNFAFNILPVQLEAGDTKVMSRQFRDALQNVNPSIRFGNKADDKETKQGNEMSFFEFKGYALDGQTYNRMCIIRLRKAVLHGIFNCPVRSKEMWSHIAEQCFWSVKEEI